MKSKSGFTIVELIITTIIIALLTGISIFAYIAVQKDARDSTRKGVAIVISEALEKYHDTNNEYPSEASLSNTIAANTGSVVADILKIHASDILMPNMPAGATNPITSDVVPHDNYISYTRGVDTPVTPTNPNPCISNADGICQFELKYVEESGTPIKIKSRY
jgi:prepilin-type N-terminal cleavage/methylation domain-containing protein